MPVDDIRVLLAEDSPTIRRHLANMINVSPGMRVVGEAGDGEEALALTKELRPDVVSMDIRMPRLDGLAATRLIMEHCPTPVVVVSGLLETDVDLSFHAIQAGALAVVEKPPDRNNPVFPDKHRQLISTLSAMAHVSVVHRRAGAGLSIHEREVEAVAFRKKDRTADLELIAIGASAGGPGALRKLLRELPPDLSVPVVVSQHMSHEFIAGLARWLNKSSPLEVRVAEDGLVLEAGVVNLSPGIAHLGVARNGSDLVVRLIHEWGPYRYQPSVDVLFKTVAEVCGAGAIGLVLSGMGEDGAEGLLAMREVGGHTFAQDEASSTVFGMPGAAIERGAVEHIVPLANLASALLKLIIYRSDKR